MKFLFVGNTAWSMWNFRKDVMFNLKQMGHEIVVVAPKDEFSVLIQEHFKFHELKHLSRKGKNPFRDFSLLIELFKIYKLYKPSLIFHYTIKPNLYGSIAAFFCRIHSCSMVAGMGHLFTKRSILTFFAALIYRISTILSFKVLFLNSQDIFDFKRLFMLPKKGNKALLLPGEGVDTEYFSPAGNKPFRDQGDAVFLFIGRLLLDKGIKHFLDSASVLKKEYPNITFKVLGSIDKDNPSTISEEELQRYISNGSIEYLGWMNDVRTILADIDALVVPTFYGEGLSGVILQSFSMGKPVISTDNRGCVPLVKDNLTGFVFPMSKMEALPSVLKKFIFLNADKRNEMGDLGRQLIIKEFSNEKVFGFYKDLINDFSKTIKN